MSRVNSFYVFIFLAFVTLMTVNSFYFKGSSSFLGVTYAKAYKINAEKSGIINNLLVVPGQEVQKGDKLIEVESPQLNLDIQKLRKEIELFKSEKREKKALLDSKIKLLESEKSILKGEIENDIRLIQNEIDLNNKLTQTISKDIPTDSLTALKLQIKSIREKGNLELQGLDIRILDLKQEDEFDQSQIQSKIELANEELEWKLREERRLNKFATFSGVIENVYVKEGEEVEAFTSLVSINPKHPTSVVGYLVGKKERDRELGEIVTVKSLEQPNLQIQGKIIGFGAVVELPQIMEKDNSLTTFGLEIFIEIPEDNPLVVGEQIIVK
ncbi:MAG: biotin/lipoyl-binding protein [Balneola sp.]|jgi:HlyD family secretion protein|nr:biotin/lipoyl-binding protein [Balneola sp.]